MHVCVASLGGGGQVLEEDVKAVYLTLALM